MQLNWTNENSTSQIKATNYLATASDNQGSLQLCLNTGDVQSDAQQMVFQIAELSQWETYLRGSDFVAIDDAVDQHLRTKIYFRATDGTEGIELIASRQTSLLEKSSDLEVTSQLSDLAQASYIDLTDESSGPIDLISNKLEKLLSLTDQAAIFCKTKDGLTFVMLLFPGDAKSISSTPDGDASIQLKTVLLGEELEKGVIRQSRMRLSILEDSSPASVKAACARFLESEVPLST